MPTLINVPTFVPCGAVLLEFGTEEQKKRHIPAMLKGEELWMQFLSEPSGGSDVAGALTTAVRDGDEWVINGSKVWTTGAWWSDYGLCLLRTNWEVPKHQGLSVFIIKIRQPDIEVQRIEMINGSREFCQEYMTDLRISDDLRVGAVDDGWTIGRRWMFHERNAMGGGSPYVSGRPPSHGGDDSTEDALVALARDTDQLDDPRVRDLIGEARALQRAGSELSKRIGDGDGHRRDPRHRSGGGAAHERRGRRADHHDPPRPRRFIGGGMGRRRPRRRRRHRLPDAPVGEHRRRHHGDGPQQHQRAGARHAPRAHARQGRRVPRGTQGTDLEAVVNAPW